ncbi:MAG: helix-turn-helix transcriptional regulator [Bacteroidaceae bacterium]|nr:helix-turn-helix transcriptional regulator [Bacteroidaceae bacterium]MBR1801401.1 helix-turn-helix transcriptional regulator [Bacteroidaceae bacterium]
MNPTSQIHSAPSLTGRAGGESESASALIQIGERLRGLRDVLDIEAQEVADLCGITLEHYLQMESGEGELSVANLQKIAKEYGVELNVLLFGEEPHMSSYFLTRKGQGLHVERRKAYNYESLASGFRGRKADPFIVTVEPKPEDTPRESNSHPGQEFNMVLEGTMELTIGQKTLVLNEGDSIYFDATQPHGMRALNNHNVKFFAIIF